MNAPHPLAVTAAPEADFAEIAAALGIRKESVRMRAKRDGWKFSERKVRGGRQHAFALTDLPYRIASKIAARRAVAALKQARCEVCEFTLVVDGEVFLVKRLGDAK